MDKYDKAIQYLRANPSEIYRAYSYCESHQAGCLFQFVTKTGRSSERHHGCLCLLRFDPNLFWCDVKSLDIEIKNDTRIPIYGSDITVDNLHIFAELQRKIDVVLERT